VSALNHNLGSLERRAGVSLALIYAIRMLGLFMIIPVFALFAEDLPGATPLLTGLALGVYGLTQAVLQIPFGMMSDRIGRKPVIVAGLLIFALGSLLAASADSIWGIIAGRALQGAGAIAAALMALAADLSREEHRLKMMALIGASIGVAFAISMVAGPVVSAWIGVSGIFAGTAVLALVAIAILYLWVPDPKHIQFHRDTEVAPESLGEVLRNPQLLRLDSGIFVLHFVLMAVFLVFPLELRDLSGLPTQDHWRVYLPVFIAAVVLMLPFIIFAEKKRLIKQVFVGAISVIMLAVADFSLAQNTLALVVGLVLFFTGFNLLEALLPSLVSKTANATQKGTAMGVYSSSQFFGAFSGGFIGGAAHNHLGIGGVYGVVLLVLLLWWLLAVTMQPPRYLTTWLLNVGAQTQHGASALAETMRGINGVVEVSVIAEEGIAYLKVEKRTLDEEKLLSFRADDNTGSTEGV
jgi:MFS family permease